jgi:aminoglycoside phosphotransferase (APT) family kinase protein
MPSAPGLFAHAVAAGLVTTSDVLSGRVTVYEQSRSNFVHRVDLDGRPVAYVKHRGAAAALDEVDPVRCEKRVLGALAGSGVAPEVVHSVVEGTLWVTPVDGIPLYAVSAEPERLRATCRSWGAALAGLHQVAVPEREADRWDRPQAERPWVLDPDRLPPSMQGRPDGTALDLVLDLATSPAMRQAAATVATQWSPHVWVHGDLSPANVLLDESGHDPVVRFVDFELAGLGPAEWDLATALDSLGDLMREWASPGLVEEFVSGYRSAGGPGVVVPAYLAVRAVVSAWQTVAGLLTRGDEHGAWAAARLRATQARHWAERSTRAGAA